jgi:prepilin-type N-terminal cleavage/methylation domain-containing protein
MKSRKNDSKSGFTLIEVIITLVIIAIVAAMMTAYFGTGITQSSLPIFRLSNSAKLNQIMEKITFDYNKRPPTWSPNTTYDAGTIILPTLGNRKGYQYFSATGETSGGTEPTWPRPKSSCTTGGNLCTVDDLNCTACTVGAWAYSGTTPPKNWSKNTLYTVNAIVYPSNGYQYVCTTGGTSGAAPPSWTTTLDSPVPSDNGVIWTCRGLQPLFLLQNYITANSANTAYGDNYSVIENRFIKFELLSSGSYRESPASGDLDSTDSDYGKYLKVTIGLPPGTGETITTLFVRR